MAEPKGRTLKVVGIGLIVLSGAFWLLIPLVHMLKISLAWKATIDGILLVAAEIAFWVGTFLAGKDLLIRLKDRFKRLIFGRASGAAGTSSTFKDDLR